MTKWWYYSSLNCLALYFLKLSVCHILSMPIVSFCFPSEIDRPYAIQTHLNSVNRITSASVSLIKLILMWVSPVPRNYFSASFGPCNELTFIWWAFPFCIIELCHQSVCFSRALWKTKTKQVEWSMSCDCVFNRVFLSPWVLFSPSPWTAGHHHACLIKIDVLQKDHWGNVW